MMKAWLRKLEVALTSPTTGRQFVFGNEWQNGKDDLDISVSGHKYMSTLKDVCTIKISNLTYSQVLKIISGKFYDVTVKCGYRSGNFQTIFDGAVLYISNAIDDAKTHTIIILCASKLVARYGQSRINLSLNSGINMYSAVNFVCKRAGIQNAMISQQLKTKIIQDIASINDTPGAWINKLCEANQSYITNSDSSVSGSIVSLFNADQKGLRVIKLNQSTIDISGGYPQLTSDGLSLTVMPTFNFVCGDVIQIDNSIVDLSISSASQVSSNPGYYLDKDGMYMIFEIEYRLTNRSSEFSLTLNCKTRSLISNYIGG